MVTRKVSVKEMAPECGGLVRKTTSDLHAHPLIDYTKSCNYYYCCDDDEWGGRRRRRRPTIGGAPERMSIF